MPPEAVSAAPEGIRDPDLQGDLDAAFPPAGGAPSPGSEEPPAELPQLFTPERVQALIKLPFGIIAKRRGAHWALDDREASEIANVLARVLDRWAPAVMAKYQDEVVLVGLLGMAIASRAAMDEDAAA